MAERLQNDDTSLPIPLISVLQESLVRAKAHTQFIEQRIAVHEANSGRRTARAALIHVARIELTIAECDRNAKALRNAIRAEDDPTSAKRKMQLRDDLMRAIPALKRQLALAKPTPDQAVPASANGDSRLPSSHERSPQAEKS